MHGQTKRLFGLALDVATVFGNQRHQLAAEADIQCHQYREQGTDAQPQRVKATRTRFRRPMAMALQVVYP